MTTATLRRAPVPQDPQRRARLPLRVRRRRSRLRRCARGPGRRVTDDAQLQRLARVFAGGGWAPYVADGGFTHEFSAPSAGPPPWYVYEFTLEEADAVMTEVPGGATRWTF